MISGSIRSSFELVLMNLREICQNGFVCCCFFFSASAFNCIRAGIKEVRERFSKGLDFTKSI